MKIVTAGSIHTDSTNALNECFTEAGITPDHYPDWLLLYYSDHYDGKSLLRYIALHYPEMTVMGGSSCLGIMTDKGFFSREGIGLGIFGIFDPDGSYGSAVVTIGEDPVESAREAVEAALTHSDRLGEMPEMIWITAAPGNEESLIEGVESVVGSSVPIAGGSSGDNSVSGNWSQFAGGRLCTNGVAISVLFPSSDISHAFHSGYDPTDNSGIVTEVQNRTVHTIDNVPAAKMLHNWTQIFDDTLLEEGGNILAKTSMSPIGREVGQVGKIPYYKLSHPHLILPGGSVSFFTEMHKGDRLIQMTGSRESLISRAGRVVQAAITASDWDSDTLSGALIIFCAGCMLTVKDDMDKVVESIADALGDIPFFGAFTFGEQGCFVGDDNSHGNLMISVVCFEKDQE